MMVMVIMMMMMMMMVVVVMMIVNDHGVDGDGDGDTVVIRWMKTTDLLGSSLVDSSHSRERCPTGAALLVIVQHFSVFQPAASCTIFTYMYIHTCIA